MLATCAWRASTCRPRAATAPWRAPAAPFAPTPATWAHRGAPGKFNWTLTEALVRLLAAHGGVLDGDARALMARHYSAALLGSAAAREAFVAPDLAPLPG